MFLVEDYMAKKDVLSVPNVGGVCSRSRNGAPPRKRYGRGITWNFPGIFLAIGTTVVPIAILGDKLVAADGETARGQDKQNVSCVTLWEK